jgi:alpha-1,6-mannosyltransferase
MTRPLGVDTTLFHPARRNARLRRRLDVPPETRLLVFAGRFAREKNIGALTEAVRRLGPRYHLILIGSGARQRPQPNVTWWGYLQDQRQLAAVFAGCDALVHAGNQETFGLVVLEGMASGLPVVAVRGGAVSELVTPETGIVADAPAPAALAAAIDGLFASDWWDMGRRARSHVERCYAWDAVMRDLVGCYARLAASQVHGEALLYAMR